MVSAALHLRLSRKHGYSLALHIFGLGLLVYRVGGWKLEEGEVPFLSSCALGRQIEQLLRCAQLLVDS